MWITSEGETASMAPARGTVDEISRAGIRDSTSPKTSVAAQRDHLYLFACHLEWRDRGNIKAYQELVAALDDRDEQVRAVAESLLHRSSPRPQPQRAISEAKRR